MIGLFAGLVLGILGESDLDVLYFQINPTSQITTSFLKIIVQRQFWLISIPTRHFQCNIRQSEICGELLFWRTPTLSVSLPLSITLPPAGPILDLHTDQKLHGPLLGTSRAVEHVNWLDRLLGHPVVQGVIG